MAEEHEQQQYGSSTEGQHHQKPNKMASGEEKHRHHHHEEYQYQDHHLRPAHPIRRLIFASISIFLLLAGTTALVLWLVYRPEEPQFSVVAAAVYALNSSSSAAQPPSVSAAMQFTLVARNPNRRVSIYYDRLAAFVAYRDEPLTPRVQLPPLFQPTRSSVAMSPVLGGEAVAVSAQAADGLAVDAAAYGVVGLTVVLSGRVRWKAGAIRTGHYGFYVRCDVLLGLRRGVVGQLPLLRSPPCKVDL